ncbi:MAG: single-stranded-DNA-specific exonuclease RecJ [Candidatus Omnitrophota bacterium]
MNSCINVHWKFKPLNESAAERIHHEAGLSPLLSRLLILRGISAINQVKEFLDPELQPLPDPFLFSEMQTAIDRILLAKEKNQRILIHGDYDVDGVTGTCILLETLWDLGIQAEHYLPDRLSEGYGLHTHHIPKFAGEYDLLVTVDCGATAHEALREAQRLGLDAIVADHHDPGAERPPALAILNPLNPEESYPSKCLCGAGVAWKLACALRAASSNRGSETNQLELAALGTVADVVPLVQENRVLLARSWECFRRMDRPGLSALMELSNIVPSQIDAAAIGFRIGPRLNAAGRMDSPESALELLITRDETRARELARWLHELNDRRRSVEKNVFDEASAIIEQNRLLDRCSRVLMASGNGWHRGVLGLAAQHLVKRYGRPVFLLSRENDKVFGSARSVDGIDLIPILHRLQPYTLSCGGHAGAAGMKMEFQRLNQFEQGLYAAAEEVWPAIITPPLQLDASLVLEQIDGHLMADLQRLHPFGHGNEEPVFYARASLDGFAASIVGNNHLRIKLRHPRGMIDAVGFGMGGRLEKLSGNEIELAFHCRANEYRGRKSIDLHLLDFAAFSRPVDIAAPNPSPSSGILDRNRLGRIYRLLDQSADENRQLVRQNAYVLVQLEKCSKNEFDTVLKIFSEIDLLALDGDKIQMKAVAEKKDLSDSPTYRSLAVKST